MASRVTPDAPWLVEAAGQHHERLDGTGYPGGLRELQIKPLIRLLSVCDVYAAMCQPRAYRAALGMRTALTDVLLLAENGGLDRNYAEQLLHLSFYPIGSAVELSDGTLGVVIATHPGLQDLNTPARPVVALLTDAQGQLLPGPRHVNLAEVGGRSILRSLTTAERANAWAGAMWSWWAASEGGGMFLSRNYLTATRHPWSCLVFVLPLLLAYEAGVLVLGLDQPAAAAQRRHVWLRWVLASMGLRHLLWAPSLLVVVLLLWSCRRLGDRPGDGVGVWVGMTAESGIFALTLWGGCLAMAPLLYRLGVQLNAQARPEPAMQQLLCFIGAGITRKRCFVWVLFSSLRWLLERIDIPWPGAGTLAALVSALLFSAAHNLGPYGEDFQPFVFAFRVAAGLYFVLLYQIRGFGIAVGAHTGYDVLVGMLAEF